MSEDAHSTYFCACCRDAFRFANDGLIRWDADLDAQVCTDCKVQLRWAQAHMKCQGIKGCALPEKRF